MASIRKRGQNSYLIVLSRSYDYEGNRLKAAQKTVHPPKELTPSQCKKWLNEQAVLFELFEREVRHDPQPVNHTMTLAAYTEHWLRDIAPDKLAASTYSRDQQDIRRILPALGHYKLTELRKETIRAFYEAMRSEPKLTDGQPLSERSVEGLHNTLCSILSGAVDEGYLTHNPAWRVYKPKGVRKERPVADEETVQKLISALETQSMKYEVLQQEAEDQPAIRDFALRSEQELDRMDNLVQNLLKIAKLDAGTTPLEKAEEPVAGLMEAVRRQFSWRARQEGKTLELAGADDVTLVCDRVWMLEAVGNLVKNALDHTEAGATVTIQWKAFASTVQITVADTGSGIHPEDLPHIFKRFYRSRFSKDTQGVGLGLPLAKAIVESHDGTIQAESEPGRGAVFTLRFWIPAKL